MKSPVAEEAGAHGRTGIDDVLPPAGFTAWRPPGIKLPSVARTRAGIYGFLWLWLATHDASGKATLPAAKLPALATAAVAACDRNDGLEDGVIADPRACHFDPAALACTGTETNSCLTPQQIDAVRQVYKMDPVFPGSPATIPS